MDQGYRNALCEVMAIGRRKGLVYLSPRTLHRLARVQPHEASLRIGSAGHYQAIAHHARRDRFERRDFIVIPDSFDPTHDELFEIAMATLGHRSGTPQGYKHGDIVDLLRASLGYPRTFGRAARLLTELGVGVPQNASEDYQRYVRRVVVDNLRYPAQDAPRTRATRMKLVFLDALPIAPTDPRLTDFESLVRLAEAIAEQTA
jgi:hypothetical protein